MLGLGFHKILTAALGPGEQKPFLEFGYRIHEPLRLLELNLDPDTIDRSRRSRGPPDRNGQPGGDWWVWPREPRRGHLRRTARNW